MAESKQQAIGELVKVGNITNTVDIEWCGFPKGGITTTLKDILNKSMVETLLEFYPIKGYDGAKAVFDGNTIRMIANIINIATHYVEDVLNPDDECDNLSDLMNDYKADNGNQISLITSTVITIGESHKIDKDDPVVDAIQSKMLVSINSSSTPYTTDDDLIAELVAKCIAVFIKVIMCEIAVAMGTSAKKIKPDTARVAIMSAINGYPDLAKNKRYYNLAFVSLVESLSETKYVKPVAPKEKAKAKKIK
jgi:hypothetical protein